MVHTAFDVMKEYMITGAELDGKYQFPVIPAAFYEPGDTIDFADSFKRSIKNHRELNVNFYIHDNAFERVYANPDRYLDHLRCFHSVCGLDYSIASGEQGMPFAMQIWNKYRKSCTNILPCLKWRKNDSKYQYTIRGLLGLVF